MPGRGQPPKRALQLPGRPVLQVASGSLWQVEHGAQPQPTAGRQLSVWSVRRPSVQRVVLGFGDLTAESIEDAAAYWLYSGDDAWERWRLASGSVAISPNGQVLRLSFELDGDTFDLAVIQRDSQVVVKYDDHDDPEQELPARLFESDDEAIVTFVHKDQIVFVHLELAA